MKKLIGLYCFIVLVAMTWVSWYACVTPSQSILPAYTGKSLNVIGGFVTVCSEPWGLATMFDAYFGFITFGLYVAWRESTTRSRILWLLALLLLGNFAIATYLLGCLYTRRQENDLGKIFFAKK